jgi:hypothetical protein
MQFVFLKSALKREKYTLLLAKFKARCTLIHRQNSIVFGTVCANFDTMHSIRPLKYV